MPIRLINTETLALEVFSDPPPYAILSHTWAENQEVSLRDMALIAENPFHEAASRGGYAKILAACRKARNRGIGHAWIDTCCIDQSSPIELAEAVNSMFRWYRDAEVCLAYLSDLPADDPAAPETAMRRCRWFTRGWCLQELIAPRALDLFDAGWNFWGSRAEMKKSLAAATGIGEEILDDCAAARSLPVARRMSWASRRSTTRPEDGAYCLLGLFDVSIPILYGEGGPAAFLRLQEEIIRRSNDVSIFCFVPRTADDFHTHPYVSNANGLETAETISRLRFCDMLARSAADFADCGTMVRRPGAGLAFDEPEFSVTNRGVRLGKRGVYLAPREGVQCYGLEVDYELAGDDQKQRSTDILLRKIGRGVFARVPHARVHVPRDERQKTTEEICVLGRVSPATEVDVRKALRRTIRVRVRAASEGIRAEITSRPSPQESWDEAAGQFLLPRAGEFSAYLQIKATDDRGAEKSVFLGCSNGKGMFPYEPRVAMGDASSRDKNKEEERWSSGLWRFTRVQRASPSHFQLVLGPFRFVGKIVREGAAGGEMFRCTVEVHRVTNPM
ncbi:hypothetical protein CSOJ01_10680 [Colletotrichum sojae]|uniref:HET domain-containing protein n=1 Tax=Colletotrichum sojae TaxID=2175907 RepID=A0A8H6J0A1_9PEZI|nr:hypothetical protein CSOJ01_10680 [Colletotrichum sojae]